MSVADYINNHYSPYMCSTDRHKWVVIIEPTEEADGIKHCEWCGIEQKIIYLTLLKCFRCHRDIDLVPVMCQSNSIIEGIFEEAGAE